MTISKMSQEVARTAKELRRRAEKIDDSLVRFPIVEIAGNFEKLGNPRGGIELAAVCSECGCPVEDDEIETIEECENCGQPFYEID